MKIERWWRRRVQARQMGTPLCRHHIKGPRWMDRNHWRRHLNEATANTNSLGLEMRWISDHDEPDEPSIEIILASFSGCAFVFTASHDIPIELMTLLFLRQDVYKVCAEPEQIEMKMMASFARAPVALVNIRRVLYNLPEFMQFKYYAAFAPLADIRNFLLDVPGAGSDLDSHLNDADIIAGKSFATNPSIEACVQTAQICGDLFPCIQGVREDGSDESTRDWLANIYASRRFVLKKKGRRLLLNQEGHHRLIPSPQLNTAQDVNASADRLIVGTFAYSRAKALFLDGFSTDISVKQSHMNDNDDDESESEDPDDVSDAARRCQGGSARVRIQFETPTAVLEPPTDKDNGEFYSQGPRPRRCLLCPTELGLQKYSIVPMESLLEFPNCFMLYQCSCRVALLCKECLPAVSDWKANILTRPLAEAFRVTSLDGRVDASTNGATSPFPSLKQGRSSALSGAAACSGAGSWAATQPQMSVPAFSSLNSVVLQLQQADNVENIVVAPGRSSAGPSSGTPTTIERELSLDTSMSLISPRTDEHSDTDEEELNNSSNLADINNRLMHDPHLKRDLCSLSWEYYRRDVFYRKSFVEKFQHGARPDDADNNADHYIDLSSSTFTPDWDLDQCCATYEARRRQHNATYPTLTSTPHQPICNGNEIPFPKNDSS